MNQIWLPWTLTRITKTINSSGYYVYAIQLIVDIRITFKLQNSMTTQQATIEIHNKYSKIPILRPPLGLSKSGLKDHFWTVPKVVSHQMYTGCKKNEEKNSLSFQNENFDR